MLDWIADLISEVWWRRRYGMPPGQSDDGRGPPRRGPVPDVRGLDVDDAISVLARHGFRGEVLRLEERPAPVMGTVVDQDPEAGTRRRRGSRVVIHVLHPRDPRA